MKSARLTVLYLLIKMSGNSYSNIILDKALTESDLTLQDKKFASSLFYGVIERLITLDYIISTYSSKQIDKLDTEILQILRMGIYQLLYMPSVPESAAVNESVLLVKQVKKNSVAGFVNAILRNFIRNNKAFKLPKEEIKSLSIEYSCPEWLVKKWIKEYGEENITSLLENTIKMPITSVRVNNLTINESDLIDKFELEDIKAVKNDKISSCLEIEKCGLIENLSSFKNGYFHIQDLSSQLCCLALAPKKGDIVLDLCAAPGGKSFTLAELMENDGELYAFDLHEKRVDFIKSGADRLKLTCIKANSGNAKEYDDKIPLADKILCDVPCAGLGVIAKKPEIKYKNPNELFDLPKIQYEILENAVKYLKIGGELIYSTCSLSREENDDIIDKFLSLNTEFVGCSFLENLGEPFGSYKATILPKHFESDGFFISKIVRIR